MLDPALVRKDKFPTFPAIARSAVDGAGAARRREPRPDGVAPSRRRAGLRCARGGARTRRAALRRRGDPDSLQATAGPRREHRGGRRTGRRASCASRPRRALVSASPRPTARRTTARRPPRRRPRRCSPPPAHRRRPCATRRSRRSPSSTTTPSSRARRPPRCSSRRARSRTGCSPRRAPNASGSSPRRRPARSGCARTR